jgi:hypothetical protein
MKNGKDKLYLVKKNISINNEVLLMEGDMLQYISSDRDIKTDQVYHEFVVINSAWCNGIEVSWTSDQVAEYLRYKTIYV